MKFVKKVFLGIAIGAGVGLALYVLGFALECVCYPCHCLGFMEYNNKDGWMLEFMWSGIAFRNTIIFCLSLGTLIGGIWGVVEQTPANRKAKSEREADNSFVLNMKLETFRKRSNDLMEKATLSFNDLQYHYEAMEKEAERCIDETKRQQDIARKLVDKN